MEWKSLTRNLIEAPVDDIGFAGDAINPGSFNERELASARDTAFMERVKRFYAHSPVALSIQLHNAAGGEYHGRNVSNPNETMTYSGQIPSSEFIRLTNKKPLQDAINGVIMTNDPAADGLTPVSIGQQLIRAILRADHNTFSPEADALWRNFKLFIQHVAAELSNLGFPGGPPTETSSPRVVLQFVGKIIGTTNPTVQSTYATAADWLIDVISEWLKSGEVTFSRSFLSSPRLLQTRVKMMDRFLLKNEQRIGTDIDNLMRQSAGRCYIL